MIDDEQPKRPLYTIYLIPYFAVHITSNIQPSGNFSVVLIHFNIFSIKLLSQ